MKQVEYTCLIVDRNQRTRTGYVTIPVFTKLVGRNAIRRVRRLLMGFNLPTPYGYIRNRLPQRDGEVVSITRGSIQVVLMASTRPMWRNSPEQIFRRNWSNIEFTTDQGANRQLLQEYADKVGLKWKGQDYQARANRKFIQDKVIQSAKEAEKQKRG